jgi:hypothetical protein
LTATALLALAVTAGPASAGKNGPNNASAKLCQKGGWEGLQTTAGPKFESEEECVSAAANGATLIATAQALCARDGGTYSDPTGAWTCEGISGLTVAEWEALAEEYFVRCTADGGGFGGSYTGTTPSISWFQCDG